MNRREKVKLPKKGKAKRNEMLAELARARKGWRAHALKLDRRLGDQILRDVRRGIPVDTAAKRAGVHRSTLRRWVQRASDYIATGEPEEYLIYATFAAELERAAGEFLAGCVEELLTCPADGWRRWASVLARRDRHNWAREQEQSDMSDTSGDFDSSDEYL